jgi:OOP family OmpA-OmpF porin
MVLSDHWSAKADARLIYSEEARSLDNTLTIGLSYAFNHQNKKVVPLDGDNDGVIDPIDTCLTTPTGTTVDNKGCALDSDNDGVVDYKDSCPNSPAGSQVDVAGCGLDSDNDGVADYKDNCLTTPVGRAVDGNGCKFVLTRSEELSLKINFANDSAVITEEYYAEIEQAANFLKKYADVNSVIEGHTDNLGADDYNTNLSKDRA